MPRKGFSNHYDFKSYYLGSVGEWDEATASSLYLDDPDYWQLKAVPLKKANDSQTHAVAFRNTIDSTGGVILVECDDMESVFLWITKTGVNEAGNEAMAQRGKRMTSSEVIAGGWIVD